ncbi:hypothetical protein [Siccibacter turicensis]|uniref:Nitric oxide reductase n=1 Tax=Siccibacter turicensis TaxID=357233 RepID=A0A2P8VP93_9ENTR|nr:hypothetical protein [Siccibacter turicensis]PSN09389.1 hypothetical protein C7G83_01140 [Siccibacter turicensis]
MKLDTHLTPVTAGLIVLAVLFPYAADLHLALFNGGLVQVIEDAQALWLLFGAAFTLCYAFSSGLPARSRTFWLWAVVWWVVLFGRSISWGRDYFPDEPKLLFRGISVILIGTLVLMPVFSRVLRQEVMRRLRSETLPVWTAALVVVAFLISDTVEHHRLLAPLFLHQPQYQDLIEELYEIPFMVGLFTLTAGMLRREKRSVATALAAAH